MYSYKNQLALFEIVVIFHFTFYSVFDNVNAALVSIRDFFGKKSKKILIILIFWLVVYVFK